MKKINLEEIKAAFKNCYPAQFNCLFGIVDSPFKKYAATQWHSFKAGYLYAKGKIPK